MAANPSQEVRSEKAAKVSKSRSQAIRLKGPKYVYTWGAGKADGNGGMKNSSVARAANLAEMTRISLPVPPVFTITTRSHLLLREQAHLSVAPAGADGAGVANMEKDHGTKFGRHRWHCAPRRRPSGARDSMPGMDGHDSQPRPSTTRASSPRESHQ